MSVEQDVLICLTVFAAPFVGSFGATVVLRSFDVVHRQHDLHGDDQL